MDEGGRGGAVVVEGVGVKMRGGISAGYIEYECKYPGFTPIHYL